MNYKNVRTGLRVFAKPENDHEQPQQVATVDHMDGENYIKLNRKDSPDGRHHWIPADIVKSIDESGVYLTCNYSEFNDEKLDTLPEEAETSIPRRAVI
ncbi:DUF2171 domain-containing protein [bacterium]|nr:DUF2171 domain-containing protein [bacterium]